MTTILLLIPPIAALVAFAMAFYFFSYVRKQPYDEAHQDIASLVVQGTRAYLRLHLLLNGVVFAAVLVLLAVVSFAAKLLSAWALLFFVLGGVFAMLSGLVGTIVSPLASIRTVYANQNENLPTIIKVGFRAGMIQGLVTVGLALFFAWLAYLLSTHLWEMPSREKGTQIAMVMLTFGLGASLQALLSRVSTGIFAKTADVTADTVAHFNPDLHEDDRNNPVVIADTVGDNLSDGGSAGSDFFESYVAAMIAAVVLGAFAFVGKADEQIKAILLPMALGGIGLLVSIGSSFFLRSKRWATQTNLNNAVAITQYFTIGFIILAVFPLLYFLGFPNPWGLGGAITVGLILSIFIIKTTERSTSEEHWPSQLVAESACTSTASSLISGVGAGMVSSFVSITIAVGGIIASYLVSTLFNLNLFPVGLYGVALTSVAMLLPLALTTAANLIGPIADQALAAARMSGTHIDEIRQVHALDSLGNTSATIGKSTMVLSSALTGVALIAAYVSGLKALAVTTFNIKGYFIFPNGLPMETVEQIHEMSLNQLLVNFNVFVSNPMFFAGILVGALTILFFSGKSIVAVGKISMVLVEEIRFRLNGDGEQPGYMAMLGDIFNRAQQASVPPMVFAIAIPLLAAVLLGVAGALGLIIGSLGMGFILSVFLSNTGAIFDNAKKLVENGVLGKHDADVQEQVVIGDTFGDPLKDTAAPGINSLMKMIVALAIVMSGVTVFLDSKRPPKPLDYHLYMVQANQLDNDKGIDNLKLIVENLTTQEKEIFETNEDGKAELELKKGEQFVLTLEKDDYRTFIDTIDTRTLAKDTIPYNKQVPYLPYALRGSVSMRSDGAPVKGVTVVLQDSENRRIAVENTDDFGDFNFKLQAKHTYAFKIFSDSLLVRNGAIKTDTIKNVEDEIAMKFVLDPKRVGAKIELDIRFASGSTEVDSVAAAVIDQEVVQVLLDNQDVVFEFGAHTDSRGSAKSNQKLSQRRADAAIAYAVSRGISSSQIKPVGYGESQLKNECADGVECSDEEHAENRRMEIKVLKIRK